MFLTVTLIFQVDHKIVTTTKTTTLIHTFHSPDAEDAKDFSQQGQETTFEEPSFVVTTENVVEVTEKKCVGVQQFLLEDNQESTRRTTETKSTEVIIERRSGTLEQSAAEVEESKPTEPEESLLGETVQNVINREDEFLDHLGLGLSKDFCTFSEVLYDKGHVYILNIFCKILLLLGNNFWNIFWNRDMSQVTKYEKHKNKILAIDLLYLINILIFYYFNNLSNVYPDIGPIITVTEDNSSPVDDDDFVGYYGLQSYMRGLLLELKEIY